MDRESAKFQFEDMNRRFNIEHTFPFDEAWDFVEYKRHQTSLKTPDDYFPSQYTKEEFREGIIILQEDMLKDENTKTPEKDPDFNPVKHTFCKHQYVREIFNPAGELLITKIHKVEHPFFLLKGEMSILTEKGEERISAPYYGVTPVGTKRIILAHTDCTFVTVHPTDKIDLKEIEDVTNHSLGENPYYGQER